MNNTLQIQIQEPTRGHFLWTLVDLTKPGDKPVVVDFAMGPLSSRNAALEAGTASMQRANAGPSIASGTWGGGFAETMPATL